MVARASPGEAKEYKIHSELLASMSPTLNVLVNGSMTEAQERRVVWDVDEQTLAFFCEFAYTGNYRLRRARRPNEGASVPGPAYTTVMNSNNESVLVPNFDQGNEFMSNLGIPAVMPNPRPGPRPNRFLNEACVAHARLLIFADYRLLEDLAKLASESLSCHLDDRDQVPVWALNHYQNPAITRALVEVLGIEQEFPDRLIQVIVQATEQTFKGHLRDEGFRVALDARPRVKAAMMQHASDMLRYHEERREREARERDAQQQTWVQALSQARRGRR